MNPTLFHIAQHNAENYKKSEDELELIVFYNSFCTSIGTKNTVEEFRSFLRQIWGFSLEMRQDIDQICLRKEYEKKELCIKPRRKLSQRRIN